MISSKVIADSVSDSGHRITTLQLAYPRFIHGEFMTHRVFSRNAMSSRAIPVKKVIQQVRESPELPVNWGANRAGMSAAEEIKEWKEATSIWTRSANHAAYFATSLEELGLHKQVINRILEPFQTMHVVVTATEWVNFFTLRNHEDAQPEIQQLAKAMKESMINSKPTLLGEGDYHLPYITLCSKVNLSLSEAIKCSIARCARVSYLNHDQSKPSTLKDLALYDMLQESGHLSPFEHVATPITTKWAWQNGETHRGKDGSRWSGNFRDFIQYRQML